MFISQSYKDSINANMSESLRLINDSISLINDHIAAIDAGAIIIVYNSGVLTKTKRSADDIAYARDHACDPSNIISKESVDGALVFAMTTHGSYAMTMQNKLSFIMDNMMIKVTKERNRLSTIGINNIASAKMMYSALATLRDEIGLVASCISTSVNVCTSFMDIAVSTNK